MNYDAQIMNKIRMAGALGYSYKRIVNILELNEADASIFILDFFDIKSMCRTEYEKGCDLATFSVDSQLFKMAQRGNKDALKEYTERRDRNVYQAKKDAETYIKSR